MNSRLHRRFGPWLLHHALEFKWFYLGAFSCLYLLQYLQSQIPARVRSLTELMAQGDLHKASVWIFMGLAVGILIFRTFSRLLFFYPARVQQKLLRMELLGLLESVPPERYKEKSQGQIFQILFDDINNLRAFVGFGLLQVGNLIIAAWVLVPKVNQSDSYLWPAFIPLFASVLLFSVFTMINQKLFKKMMDKKGEVQQYIIEAYEAKQTIKNFHREDNFIKGFMKVSSEELSLFFKSSVGFAFTGPYIKLGLGASLLWGGLLVRAHGGKPSDLVFFSGFLYLFLEPVMFLSWVAVVVSQGFAAWKRVKELYFQLEITSETEIESQKNTLRLEENRLVMDLYYWDHHLQFDVPQGEWTIFIGETGSGKSHLLTKMATHFILKGHRISMVQQEPYLFNDTIEENLFLGKRPSSEDREKAKELLRMFQLDSLAPNLEDVMKLEVGENGKRLSGGQVKRVALVRSLLSGSQILIWDDPFSSVDIILEKRIMTAIKGDPKLNSITFIISGHRLTTVKLSHRAIFLKKDKGIEIQGQVDDVLKDPHVHQFFKEQFVEIPLA